MFNILFIIHRVQKVYWEVLTMTSTMAFVQAYSILEPIVLKYYFYIWEKNLSQ